MEKNEKQDKLTTHFIGAGFIYQSSEIYGGLANSWDCGPLGVLIKNNLKKIWWDYFVTQQKNMVGIDSNIILNSDVWKASKHVENFADPLIDCKSCKSRFRVDKLIENFLIGKKESIEINEQTSYDKLEQIIMENKICCPVCKKQEWTSIRKFNLLFETSLGVVENKKNSLFLRPETAQGIFINFKNIQRTTRMKIPFGVAQIGKAFRNEITPGNFIFRTREFEQMEIEFFCHSNEAFKVFENYQNKIELFLTEELGIKKSNLKKVDYPKEELAHYANQTTDFFYKFNHGWSELWGISNRGNFDLNLHQEFSKKSLEYQDPKTNEKYLPFVIEPSVGVERLLYAILIDAYDEEIIKDDDTRIVMRFNYDLCPYKICVLPLANKLSIEAQALFEKILAIKISATYDESGSIGKRYRRQDAIGTKYCITFDFDSLEDQSVTIRERDSMKQVRIKIDNFLENIHKLDQILNKI